MAVGEMVGGALLSAFVNVLFERFASREVLDFFRGKEPIVKLLKELQTTLNSAGLLLDDAEQKLIKDQRVKKWLDDLKDTVYDADDLVYKISTEALRNELEGESQGSFTNKVLIKLVPTSFTTFDKKIKPKMDEILGNLKLLLEQKNNLGLEHVKTKQPERLLAPLVEEYDVYGRDADKEAIIRLLLSNDAGGNNLSVIPIVGMGGIGKTTLAQLVFKDERVDKMFDTKAWVTVGEEKVDCLKVMKIIIEKVTSEKCEIEEPYDLQDKAKKALSMKKFLFVFDDVWDEDPNKWDILKGSFKSGVEGSKIIVTTRSTVVASIMKTGTIHHLKGVSYDDSWQLFAKHSSIDVNSNRHSDLQIIGRKIVEKCEGLPLAIKSLGGLLRDKRDKEEWDSILNSDIWELYARRRISILPALWLSYYSLPSYLKPCFAYCALFPQDYEYVKGKMILLWMAEGLLEPKNGKTMEEIGEEYFQDLISRSFFQPSSKDESALLMHDLMHDLAVFVSGEFCLEMDDPKFSNFASKVRHLSYREKVDVLMKLEGLSKAMGLRTFLTLPNLRWSTERSLQVEQLLESLLRASSCLRVLSITNYSITKLPDSIGDLKYLKYMDLSNTKIEEIPDAVCSLYNLQTLLLDHCNRLTRLPTNIGNLINLRHLHAPSALKEMPLQIGKMKTLQTLNNFVVGKNSESAGIKELKELQDLHGTLEISGLENVVDVSDVLEPIIKNKKSISELHLYWNWDDRHAPEDSKKEREVLGSLQPHENLKELTIYSYQGTSFPNWVGDHLYSNLVKVYLYDCKNCWLLPSLGQLSSLKQLQISSFPNLVRISSEFYYSSADSSVGKKPFQSLESLYIFKMSCLEEWSFIEGEVEGGVFPCLKEFYLTDCPRLKVSLPDYLPSLRELKIEECEKLVPLLPRAQQMDSAFPSLEMLKISYCDEQHSLLEGGLPSSLKEIKIYHCKKLTALDEEAFQRLTSLKKLEIYDCDRLQCLPRGLLTSLSDLTISYCDLLTPRVQRETGEDWPIIENIPRVFIRQKPALQEQRLQ